MFRKTFPNLREKSQNFHLTCQIKRNLFIKSLPIRGVLFIYLLFTAKGKDRTRKVRAITVIDILLFSDIQPIVEVSISHLRAHRPEP